MTTASATQLRPREQHCQQDSDCGRLPAGEHKERARTPGPRSFFARIACVLQETAALPLSYIPKFCGDEGNRTPAALFCEQSGREPAGSFLPLPCPNQTNALPAELRPHDCGGEGT